MGLALLVFLQLALCDQRQSATLAERGRQALSGGDPTLATTLFRQALEACPDNGNLQLEISRGLTAQRKFDEGIAIAQQFVAANPLSANGLLVLANAYFMAGRWKECAPVVDKALEVDRTNAAALLLKANNHYILAENGAAEQTLLKLLDLHPNDADAAYMLGRMYFMNNRPDYAMAQFQRVLKVDPKHYKAWDNLALCYDALGQIDEAIRHFLTAIKLVETDHPEYDWPYANLADLLLRQNRYQEGYQAATKAAQRNPYGARNFFIGGQALVKLERPDDAKKWLERSVELDPEFPDALYALGQLYLRTGDKEKGAETLKRFRVAKAKAPLKRR